MKSSSASEKTNPNKPNLHFTAENAEHAEKKNIYVSDCSIKKCALYPVSPCFHPSQWLCYGEWTLRTRRLMENKPNPSTGFGRLTTSPLRTGQSQLPLSISPKTSAWGNYPLRCLKKLPTIMTRTRRAQKTQNLGCIITRD